MTDRTATSPPSQSRTHGLAWTLAGVTLTAVLVALTFLDEPFYRYVQTMDPNLVGFFQIITDFGKSDWILVPTGIITIALVFSRPAWRRWSPLPRGAAELTAQGAFFIFAAVGLAGLISLTLKQVIGRARPQHIEELGAYHLDPLTFDPSFASFPSGHSTTIVALAVALGFLFPRGRILFYSIAGWVALSRVIVNAHYLSDVLAGSYIGAMTALYTWWQFTRWRLLFERRAGAVRLRAPALRRALKRAIGRGLLAAGRAWPPWPRGTLRRGTVRAGRIFAEEAAILARYLAGLAAHLWQGAGRLLRRAVDWASGRGSAAADQVQGAAGSAGHRLLRRLGQTFTSVKIGERGQKHRDGP